MIESRSASQIIYGFLPEQTIDLKGGIWKVRGWRTPKRLSEVDAGALRAEVLRQAYAWEKEHKDANGFLGKLRAGAEIEPFGIDDKNGVQVEPFPKQWVCKGCNRMHFKPDNTCACGYGSKGQLPFIAYHDCGDLREIFFERCPTHKETRIEFGKSASIADIRQKCSQCNWERIGLPYMKCVCGQAMKFNVHRAAVVYTPRIVVLVNPPMSDNRRKLDNAGGGAKALSWFLGGMVERTALETTETQETLAADLLAKGLDRDIVDRMIAASGLPKELKSLPELPVELRAYCESQAMTLALATLKSRMRIDDLLSGFAPDHELVSQYKIKYPKALRLAGLASIELLERFPIFTGHFGYTRGDSTPGKTTLRPFRHHDSRTRKNVFPVYGDLAETEALLIKLDPIKVAAWLRVRGHHVREVSSPTDGYFAVLEAAADCDNGMAIREDLLTLVHSLSHRFIRTAAVYAGIDRNSLAEIILDSVLSFIVYAVPRGDFVLGGLRAVFEREIDTLLADVVGGEYRCPLDPGCSKGKSACMACLHLGEPSCRLFNNSLSRTVLFGRDGYLASPNPSEPIAVRGAKT